MVDHVIIIFPGHNGSVDGYNNKYAKISELLKRKGNTIIRSGNMHEDPYPEMMIRRARALINGAVEITNIVYLMGISAGASSFCAIAHEYPQVRKLLLVSPSGDAGRFVDNLQYFTGEVYITYGENDNIVPPSFMARFYDLAKLASKRECVVIKNCDHQFRGTRNGKIFSKAPLWAFYGDNTYPDPEGGIELY